MSDASGANHGHRASPAERSEVGTLRAATRDDVPALTELWHSVDAHWFGNPEHDAAETAEALDLLEDIARDTRLTHDAGGRLLCAVLRGRHDSFVLVRPDVDAGPLYDDALDWLAGRRPAHVEVLDRDTAMLAALTQRDWTYSHASFELIRAVADDWSIPDPTWPDGIDLRVVQDGDLAQLHRLIYAEAKFADIPGHDRRDVDDWRRTFLDGRALTDGVVLACRAERMVGVSLVRTFSDGTGWINQLAVAPDERGRGLGRALVLESFHRLITRGAIALGLGVAATNRGALRLYLDLGLAIDREWQLWELPVQG